MTTCGKEITIGPFTGGLDGRTASGSVSSTDFRLLYNVDGQEQQTLGRLGGWLHYGSGFGCAGGNHDLHDQLLESLTPPVSDDPSSGTDVPPFPAKAITMLFSMESVGGRRRLLAASRSEIWVGDDLGGNQRILGWGLGGSCTTNPEDILCNSRRFQAAQLANVAIITNGFDRPLQWIFDTGPSGSLNWSVDQIPDLTILNITAASIVCEYGGFIFLCDIVADGSQFPGRVVWSDYNNPLGFIPGGESVAGTFDFGGGERIIAVASIGRTLRFYTDRAIYDAAVVTTGEVFNFQEIYRGNGKANDCPKYRNSFISTGEEHFFFGEDSAFVMTAYDQSPRRIEWLHRAVGPIFRGLPDEWVDGAPTDVASFEPINKSRCDQMVSGYDGSLKTIWVSWPAGDSLCPNKTLVIWPRYQKSTLVDQGFTAFSNHRPDLRMNVRDFADLFGFCEPNSQLMALEGQPCDNGAAKVAYPYFFNGNGLPSNWIGTSPSGDWTRAEMGPDGAVAATCGYCLSDLCPTCDTDAKFLMASATDKTIKQFEPAQYLREVLTGVTPQRFPVPDGATYTSYGYTSLVQGDSQNDKYTREKLVVGALLNWVAPAQSPVGQMFFQIGGGNQPGVLDWSVAESQPLLDYDGGPADATGRAGVAPSFQFYDAGIWLAWRFYVTGIGSGFTAGSTTLVTQPRE